METQIISKDFYGGHGKKAASKFIDNNISFQVMEYGQEFFKQNKGKPTKITRIWITVYNPEQLIAVEKIVREHSN